MLVFGSAAYRPQLIEKTDHEPHADIFALFDRAAPESGPFPSDIFTVEDGTENTGRRLAHPYPDCVLRPSDCDDRSGEHECVRVLRRLYALHPRIGSRQSKNRTESVRSLH